MKVSHCLAAGDYVNVVSILLPDVSCSGQRHEVK
jgi:hypothetical protein